ncbi:hypothetical protein M9H77_09471 [Catharanthus roseus]|uniref:Uncharacterized protein n=1 Tax=Catharanthus roseus TaxID=4058 RepID=A0ACC0C142_CATRO|nr:hypothetical protein M9H77_09471 [Catharanthus roseus]
MDKYFEKWKKGSKPVEETLSKKPRVGVQFSDYEIIGDPGLRKSIDSYPYEIRDELRRRILDMWDAVTHILDTILEDGNEPNSQDIARGLIDNMNQFEFVFIAHLMVDVLAETNTLSMCLQQKIQNIVTAVRMIKTVKDELKKYENDDDCWEELLGVVTAFCTKNNIFVSNMQDPKPSRGQDKLYRIVDGQPKSYNYFFLREIFF